jgi:RNA polymerase sigma-70 factor (ECF subfamily)
LSLNDPDTPQPIDPQPSPSQLTSREEQVRDLLKYLHQLPDAQREAMTLHLLESLTVKEVAAQMNLALKNDGKDKEELTEDAVSGLIRRGVKTLKRRMSQEASAEPEEDQNEAMSQNMVDVTLLAYLRRRSAGEELDPDAFADSHPACAEELRGLLHWLEQLRALRYTPSV